MLVVLELSSHGHSCQIGADMGEWWLSLGLLVLTQTLRLFLLADFGRPKLPWLALGCPPGHRGPNFDRQTTISLPA